MDPATLAQAARYDARADDLEAACRRLAAVADDLDGPLHRSLAGFDEHIWVGRTADATRDALEDSRAELRTAVELLHQHLADGRARVRRLRREAAELYLQARQLP